MPENPRTSAVLAASPEPDGRHVRGNRTRHALLEAAFDEIYEQGFRSASLNEILRRAGCTKGSLYHHFPDKHALGVAAAAEFIGAYIRDVWIEPLRATADPLATIRAIIERHAHGGIGVDPRFGCPYQNLSQELSGIDAGFQEIFTDLFERWRGAIADALARGQAEGTVRTGIDARAVATLIVASHQGVVSMIKATQDLEVGHAAATAFFDYLESLRP
ncbi:MAG: TetR/AcrR family transcriptional regulator [Parvibaculum sp.]|uniref:TetR/AcrR family transcriptional regulator n=1 Tax=Parvibaculum sp. TaxID=2024848 RepID=UPI00271E5A4F|nr:TetR/AcrR family transcriptional regulator [Parvibaculum sp.]MDO8839019.1 TetR/AcrR family transcriptional regulator [Parvibaculum sp.]